MSCEHTHTRVHARTRACTAHTFTHIGTPTYAPQVCDTEHLLDDLGSCNNSFNIIEKSLNAYLDSKKLLFPRCAKCSLGVPSTVCQVFPRCACSLGVHVP